MSAEVEAGEATDFTDWHRFREEEQHLALKGRIGGYTRAVVRYRFVESTEVRPRACELARGDRVTLPNSLFQCPEIRAAIAMVGSHNLRFRNDADAFVRAMNPEQVSVFAKAHHELLKEEHAQSLSAILSFEQRLTRDPQQYEAAVSLLSALESLRLAGYRDFAEKVPQGKSDDDESPADVFDSLPSSLAYLAQQALRFGWVSTHEEAQSVRAKLSERECAILLDVARRWAADREEYRRWRQSHSRASKARELLGGLSTLLEYGGFYAQAGR